MTTTELVERLRTPQGYDQSGYSWPIRSEILEAIELIESIPARISAARLSAFEEAAKVIEDIGNDHRFAGRIFEAAYLFKAAAAIRQAAKSHAVAPSVPPKEYWSLTDEEREYAKRSTIDTALEHAVAPSAIQSTQDTAEAGEAARGASTGQETAIRAQTREGK